MKIPRYNLRGKGIPDDLWRQINALIQSVEALANQPVSGGGGSLSPLQINDVTQKVVSQLQSTGLLGAFAQTPIGTSMPDPLLSTINTGGTVTSITGGTGISTSPSPLTGSGAVSLTDTAVTPGSYTNTNLTVDQQGRITAAANGSGGAGSQGPAGPAVFLEAEPGEDGMILGPPGLQGPTGATGATGAQGPAGPPLFLVGEDGADGDVIPGPSGLFSGPAIAQNDVGTFTIPDTGYLAQPNRLNLTTTEHAAILGSGRLAVTDDNQRPFHIGRYATGSFTVEPGEFVLQYKRLSLYGSARVTALGSGQVIVTDLVQTGRLSP